MLQITLEPQEKLNSNQSQKSSDWDFKLKLVREGDYTELRISFEDSHTTKPNESCTDGDVSYEGSTLL